MKPIAVGVLGCGHWGPNHVRNLLSMRAAGVGEVLAIDPDEARRRRVQDLYPGARVASDARAALADPGIDAVIIATPAQTHYRLAREALIAGKHVLVEKPFVTHVAEADELVALARERGRILMAGHTFAYNAAVVRVREYIQNGELGEVQYIRSVRVNLGVFRNDVNVLWDLAPHDVSILLYILEQAPTHVSALGVAHVSPTVEDVVVLTLHYPGGRMANVMLSWLDPRKVREMTIVGRRKMLVYDDVSANEKLRIYDKSVEGPKDYDSFGDFAYSYRYGDIVTPMVAESEPLKHVVADFLSSVQTGSRPRASGEDGAIVTRILVAAQWSLRNGGARAAVADAAALDAELAAHVPYRNGNPEARP